MNLHCFNPTRKSNIILVSICSHPQICTCVGKKGMDVPNLVVFQNNSQISNALTEKVSKASQYVNQTSVQFFQIVCSNCLNMNALETCIFHLIYSVNSFLHWYHWNYFSEMKWTILIICSLFQGSLQVLHAWSLLERRVLWVLPWLERPSE